VLSSLVLALVAAIPQKAPGLVVLVGEGAVLEGKAGAELAGERRVMLCVGADAFDPWSTAASRPVRIVLDPAAPFAGDAREPAELARTATCVVLSGGGYMDWYHLLTPGGSTTRLSEAIREAHSAGVTVVGVGAAAPFLAQWAMVDRAALEKPLRNPRREREDVAVAGLGLLEDLLVDGSARPRGDPGRTLRSAFDGSIGTVLFLDGPATWIGDPREHSARILGKGTAFVFDFSTARRQRETWREGRLSMLTERDAWTRRRGCECAEPTTAGDLSAADPRAAKLRTSLERMSARLSIRADERTRVSKTSACGLCFDLEWE
jgi:cyanophycinase-like exopeptidase